MVLTHFILLLIGRVERHGSFRKAGYIPLWGKQIGIRNGRPAMGMFLQYLHFMKGGSIPQEKRKVSTHQDLTRECRKDWRANAEMEYFTFIKLPCARRSHEAFDDLTKSHENDQKCSQEGQPGRGWNVLGHSYLTRYTVYAYFCRSVSTQWQRN